MDNLSVSKLEDVAGILRYFYFYFMEKIVFLSLFESARAQFYRMTGPPANWEIALISLTR